MKNANSLFKESETLIGHVILNTGTLLLTDGVWSDNLHINTEEKLAIDLNLDKVKVPVIAVRQNEQRYLLIPIDQGIPLDTPTTESVEVVDIPTKTEEQKNT